MPKTIEVPAAEYQELIAAARRGRDMLSGLLGLKIVEGPSFREAYQQMRAAVRKAEKRAAG